jgi:outer membrane lipoprotein-sorting protein
MSLGRALARVAILVIIANGALSGPAVAGPDAAGTPDTLLSGDPARGAALDPVFAHLRLDRLRCNFSEEKRVAMLAKPFRSTGTLHFARDKGIVRTTVTPKPQQVVLTRTTLRITTAKRTEEIPLDKSKDLKAFALIFPTLLRGDRAELERAFDIGLHGSATDRWALTFTPKAPSLAKLVRRVIVFGRKSELVSLQIDETSGDSTTTQLTDIRKNDAVPASEIAKAFGAP